MKEVRGVRDDGSGTNTQQARARSASGGATTWAEEFWFFPNFSRPCRQQAAAPPPPHLASLPASAVVKVKTSVRVSKFPLKLDLIIGEINGSISIGCVLRVTRRIGSLVIAQLHSGKRRKSA